MVATVYCDYGAFVDLGFHTGEPETREKLIRVANETEVAFFKFKFWRQESTAGFFSDVSDERKEACFDQKVSR